jgi:[ribosomal protein S18]-alanine N-acetyltransferase
MRLHFYNYLKMKPVIIRQYTAADKQACMNIFHSNMPKYFTMEEAGDFERFLKRLVAPKLEIENSKSWTLYYVLLCENEVIACGGIGDKNGTDVISFAWGMVHNNFHKHGFGLQLLTHRIQVKEKLFPLGKLVLDTTQHTFSFFEKYGFVTTKITKQGYSAELDRYDMVYSK